MRDGHESQLNVLLGTNLAGACEYNFPHIDAFEGPVGMKYDPHSIAGMPIITGLQFFQNGQHRRSHHVCVAVVGTLFRDIPEQISAVTTKYRSDADVFLPRFRATTGKLREPYADHELVANCLILVDRPRRAVQFRIN